MGYLDEKRFIEGGLNSDDESRVLGPGDYRYALNIHIGSSATSNMGAIEGAKGNALVPVVLPSGSVEVIGSEEDRTNGKIYYFLWAASKKHTIYEFDITDQTVSVILQSPTLAFNRLKPIYDIDVVEGMLMWTDDFNEPRKINIEKARWDKPFEYNFYFGLPGDGLIMSVGTQYSIWIKDETGATVLAPTLFHTASDPAIVDNLEEAAKVIADAMNANGTVAAEVTAEACGPYVEVTTVSSGYLEVVFLSSTHDVIAVPQNFYFLDIIDEQINSVKAPPHCEPQVSVVEDPDRVENNLLKHVFQFRLGYVFDDDEKSALGPISTIAIDLNSCSAAAGEAGGNCIEVDFTDVRLNDLKSLSIIKRAEILVRDGNLGKWKSITTLEQYQFGIGTNVYKFYNDTILTPIDDEIANKLFDNHPILAGSQEIIKDRKWYGDTLEGYDPVCIDASVDIAYEEAPNTVTHSITGKIFIRNAFVNKTEYQLHQPIWDNSDNDLAGTPVWGGFGNADIVNKVGTEFGQTLELGGFVVYLAGTTLKAISRQIDNGNPNPQDANGVYIGTKGNIRDDIRGSSGGNSGETPDTRAYSTFEIKNVPPGTYILRVASHLTTEAELADPSRPYEKSSTNVKKIAGAVQQEYIVTVVASDIDIGKIEIQDLTDPRLLGKSTAISGYVTDKDLTLPSSPGFSDYLADTRVELATVAIDFNGSYDSTIGSPYTDHNGYFWRAFSYDSPTNPNLTITGINSLANPLNADVFKSDGTPFTFIDGDNGVLVVCRNTNNTVSSNSRTRITGNVGVFGASILTERGGLVRSDSDGDFELVVYGDTPAYLATGQSGRADTLYIFLLEANCIAEFSPDSIAYSILIGPSNYNFAVPYLVGPIIPTIIFESGQSAFKRGSDPQFGIVYYDFPNRSGATNTQDSLKKHIAFYSERDSSGAQLPGGKPILSWEIKNQPPVWATHYQWVRTKNTFLNNYLQWVAKEVTYINDSGATVSFSSSTKVKISIANIGDYLVKYPNSTVGILPDKGDRVRFQYRPGGSIFPTYEDHEIIDVIGDEIVLYTDFSLGEIDEGVGFEIYKPGLDSDEKLYYEFGECFDIGNPGTDDRFHKGPVQDQDPTDPSGTPAQGVFQSGDAYYRFRTISTANNSLTRFHDDPSISDFFISNDQSIGRVNAENPDARQIRRTGTFRYSGKIFPDTRVNGLSTFDFDNQDSLPKEAGVIEKLQRVENVLLAICNFRVWVIYVDEAIITNNEGQDEIVTSNGVVGGKRALAGLWGTIHPGSVDEWQGECRFWDANTGKVIRYANNGLTPISSYKMSNYFADKAKRYTSQKARQGQVIASYDPFFDEYILCFRDFTLKTTQLIFAETVVFSEKRKRWTSFFSYHPESIVRAGQFIVTFNNGGLYLHNVNVLRGNFYGSQDNVEVKVTGNISPNTIKVFKAITEDSNIKWECPEITIPGSPMAPNGMLSRLKPSKFRQKEGKYYSEFLRDLNSPGTIIHPIINGRVLRGETIDVLLRATEFNKDLVLFGVDISSINSELNKRQV